MEENTKITEKNEAISSDLTSKDKEFQESNADTTIKGIFTEKGNLYHEKHGITKEKISFWSKIKIWLKDNKYRISSTYAKRNPMVNALLSLFLLAVVILSVFILIFAVLVSITESGHDKWCFGIAWIYYCLFCIYYMSKFILGNHKNAILPAFVGATFVWFVIFFFYTVMTTPEPEYLDEEVDEVSRVIEIVGISTILSILLSGFSLFIIYSIMKIRKYGATAWSLLDIRRGKRPKFEIISFVFFIIISLFPIGSVVYSNYESRRPIIDDFPTHSSAQIGDYYYSDGTVSPIWDVDKTVVGIVFSLETSEADKAQGFVKGQIVGYYDLSERKQPWDDNNPHDIIEYPNYNWNNRLDALKDINGLSYMHCDGYGALPMTLSCLHYLDGESTKGISNWYVPTAGQWTKILENLGNVKVDKMLKFDADTAVNYLDRLCLDPQSWYWTITEFDADNAWSIRLDKGEFGSRSNKQNRALVRPVASF